MVGHVWYVVSVLVSVAQQTQFVYDLRRALNGKNASVMQTFYK